MLALSRSWGRSRRPSAAERAPAARVPCPDEFDGGRRRGRRGAGGWRWESAAFPAPLPKVPGLRALVERSLVSLVRLRLGPPLKLFTHPTSRWKWRIDASAPRAPRAARSYRLGVQRAQRAGSTSGARSTRDAENCPQERECSPARIHRPRLALAQKAAQSSAPAEAAATG